jgi:hypothetical protein
MLKTRQLLSQKTVGRIARAAEDRIFPQTIDRGFRRRRAAPERRLSAGDGKCGREGGRAAIFFSAFPQFA